MDDKVDYSDVFSLFSLTVVYWRMDLASGVMDVHGVMDGG